jgi:MFS family permease
MVASMPAGSFVGALLVTQLADRLGRKNSIILSGLIWVVGSILQCAAVVSHRPFSPIFIPRALAPTPARIKLAVDLMNSVLNMISIGAWYACRRSYHFWSLHWYCIYRGAHLPVGGYRPTPSWPHGLPSTMVRSSSVASQLFHLLKTDVRSITWGILIQYFIQFGCSYIDGVASFRIPWGLQMIPGIILVVGMMFFPESPRWLFDHGREDEALQVLADMHGGGDISNELVLLEYEEIKEQVHFERTEGAKSYLDLFKPGMPRRVMLGICLQMWSQLTGMNVMM